MHLTREELEDIWHNKPYGYFNNYIKVNKNKKKYRITTKAYKLAEVATESMTVFAKDHNQAIASDHGLRAKINREMGESQWSVNLKFVTTAELI